MPLVLALAVAAGGAACWWWGIALPARARASAPLEASGTIEATAVDVAPEFGGRVVEVLVSEGRAVAAGDAVVRLDAAAAGFDVAQAGAALQGAEARLAEALGGSRAEQVRQSSEAVNQARALMDQAQKTLTSMRTLYDQGAATKSQLDAAEAQYAATAAQYQQATAARDLVVAGATSNTIRLLQADVARAEAALGLAQLRLDRMRVAAPAAGEVVRINVEAGEVVAPGAPVATVADLVRLWIRVYIPESRLGQVRLNQAVEVRVDAYPGKTFAGRVAHINDRAEFTPKNVQTKEERAAMVFEVKVDVPNQGGDLRPGMPADVTFLP